jgi:hypothetical protein
MTGFLASGAFDTVFFTIGFLTGAASDREDAEANTSKDDKTTEHAKRIPKQLAEFFKARTPFFQAEIDKRQKSASIKSVDQTLRLTKCERHPIKGAVGA